MKSGQIKSKLPKQFTNFPQMDYFFIYLYSFGMDEHTMTVARTSRWMINYFHIAA